MMTVHEVAKLAGVSTRTLRYYDELGLLPPAAATEAGYRLYGEDDLKRLQRILFLRELGFPLREIAPMLEAEEGDRRLAVERHRELLRLQMKRLQGLIDLCGRVLDGKDEMNLQPFNQDDVEQMRDQYAEEAKQRWGDTDAYRESQRRTRHYTKEDWAAVKAEMDAVFGGFAALVGHDPVSPEVRAMVARWKALINSRFYTCGNEMLAGIGEMYLVDKRFQKNLDAYGPGTAALMSEAMKRYQD
jgi:DNA-binding transcriptional MerR regulator